MDIMSAVDTDSSEIGSPETMAVLDLITEHETKIGQWIVCETEELDSDNVIASSALFHANSCYSHTVCPSLADTSKSAFEEGLEAEMEFLNNPFLSSALHTIHFQLDYDEMNFFSFSHPFQPTMAHQVFGQDEIIYGYRNPKFTFNILPNSFHIQLDIQSDDKRDDSLRGDIADNIPDKMRDWFPHLIEDAEEYAALKAQEDLSKTYGVNVAKYPPEGDDSLLINVCKPEDGEFIEFHKRFQALIVFYIDAASIIDFVDNNWVYFYVYQETKTEEDIIVRVPVGFCTVYKFNMSHRSRIAQLFILPNFQRRGIGSKLLQEVYNYFLEEPECQYITVESPCTEFTIMRDKLDLQNLYRDSAFSKTKVLQGYSHAMENVAVTYNKMCIAQVKHIYRILYCYYSRPDRELYGGFINHMKKEIHQNYKRKLSRTDTTTHRGVHIHKIKTIVSDNCLTNRRIHKDVRVFVRCIQPQLAYLRGLLTRNE